MDRFLRDISGSVRIALVLVLVSGTLALTIAWSDDLVTKIALALISALMVLAALRLATPDQARIIWLRYASLSVAAGVASSVLFFKDWVDHWLLMFLQRADPNLQLETAPSWLSAAVLLFMLGVVWLVNRSNIVRTATIRTRQEILDHPDNRADRDQLIEDLRTYIDQLDENLRWNHEQFIELEADIDLVLGNERRRSAGNLLQAIKRNAAARLFVVLGDPGSGKSVALRTLTRSLLNEALAGGQIPIYINLREWRASGSAQVEGQAGEATPISQFVLSFLRGQLGDVSYRFVSKHFDLLQSEGQFFFILDSFDETPAILDTDESSALIRDLSEQLYRFVLSGSGARGLVASRYFRRPTIRRHDRCVLELRPFNEARIVQLVDQQAADPETLKRRIFVESALLGSAARSPFLLSLILDYERHRSMPVPDSQAELYRSYIDQAIVNAENVIGRNVQPMPDLIGLCERIAWMMFERANLGLEVPKAELINELDSPNLEDALSAMHQQKLFRVSETGQLSFAHRRFQEYFIVRSLLERPEYLPIEAIVDDSRWRDSMVLYAEIAPGRDSSTDPKLGADEAGEAERIAEFCWRHIQVLSSDTLQSNPEAYLRGLNALRFLVEAFRGRPSVVRSFQRPFTSQMTTLLCGDDVGVVDLLNARYAVESVTFLPEDEAAEVLEVALRMESSWIAETAFRSCRYLGKVSDTVIESLDRFVLGLTFRELRLRWSELGIALSFHDRFASVVRALTHSRLQFRVCSLAFWVLLFLAPIVWLLIATSATINLIVRLAFTNENSKKNELLRRIGRSGIIDLFSRGFEPFMNGFVLIILFPFIASINFSWFPLGSHLDEAISSCQNCLIKINFFIYIPIISFILVVIVLLIGTRENSLCNIAKKINRENIFFIIFMIFLCFLGSLFVFYLQKMESSTIKLILERLDIFFTFAFYLMLAALVAFCMYKIGHLFLGVVSDRRRLCEATRVFTPDRQIVAAHFHGFATDAYRARYVSWLEEQEINQNARKRFAVRDNVWPKGVRPNVANDDASARLAQLDRTWIGIKRL